MSKQKKGKVKGKQVLLLGLVALVIAAGYYRWTAEKENFSLGLPVANQVNSENVTDENGNPKDVQTDENANSENKASEIEEMRKSRDAARSQSVEEWGKITKNNEQNLEAKKEAENNIKAETDYSDKERKIESQVKAKGFEDCIAYVSNGGVSVTVKGGEIDGSKVAQIKDVIVSVTNTPAKNIKINSI